MIHSELNTIQSLLGARLQGNNVTFTGVSIDTRTLKAGELFVALSGPRFDGHAFLAAAQANGAAAALVEHPANIGLPQLVVKDAVQALGQLANWWRQQQTVTVMALTGSCGKTSTKTLLAAIAAQAGSTLATTGNLNNHLGVPLTLLQLSSHHRFAVIEMGANHLGEIAYLTDIAQPDIALLLNAQDVHLEGFGSRAGVAKGKAEIFQGLSSAGTAILNRDDDFYPYWWDCIGDHNCLSFSLNQRADVWAEAIELNAQGQPSFTLRYQDHRAPITLQVLGAHQVANAVAAAAAAVAAGIEFSSIATGLAQAEAIGKRLQILPGPCSSTLIDDSYNGTPGGFDAAIHFLATRPGTRILVAGTMGELGEDAERLHRSLGLKAKAAGLDYFYGCGEHMQSAVAAFGDQGFYFEDKASLGHALKPQLAIDVVCLFKGSKFMQMREVLDQVRAEE